MAYILTLGLGVFVLYCVSKNLSDLGQQGLLRWTNWFGRGRPR